MLKWKDKSIRQVTRLIGFSGLLAFAVPDIVLTVAVLFFLVIGFARGFTRSLITFFGTLVSLILAIVLCSAFSRFLSDKFHLLEKFSDLFRGWLPKLGSAFTEDIGGQDLASSLGKVSLPAFLVKAVLSLSVAEDVPAETTLTDLLSPVLGNYLLLVLSFLVLFILFRLFFLLLSAFLKNIKKIPVLGAIDSILGMVLGFLQSLVFAFSVFAVISFLPAGWMEKPRTAIENSTLCKTLYEHNLIVSLVGGKLDMDEIDAIIEETIGNK